MTQQFYSEEYKQEKLKYTYTQNFHTNVHSIIPTSQKKKKTQMSSNYCINNMQCIYTTNYSTIKRKEPLKVWINLTDTMLTKGANHKRLHIK